ncbi:MAG: hypothetical protein ABIO70_02880 [Pseudomonadota bacterium]
MHRSAALLFVALPACFVQSSLVEVLPDERVQVNLPLASGLAKDDDDWATLYLFTAATTEDINRLVGTVLLWVDTITHDYRPSYVDSSESSATWGPWATALDPVQTLLWVVRDPDTDVTTWGFDQWPRDTERDAACSVVLGEVDPGATREVSTGRFSIDFDTIHALDPTEEATGQFGVDYDIGEDGVRGTATFTAFGPDGIDADYAYEQTFDGEGVMDLAVVSDLNPGGGAGLDETWRVHSRWLASGAGRADVRATGGDLGATEASVSECWDSSFARVYYTDSLSGTEDGDPESCVYAEAEYPS